MAQLNVVLRCLGAAVFGFALGLFVLNDRDNQFTSKETALDLAAFKASSAMPSTCPRPGPTMPVQAMQKILRKHGIPTSPFERFALTSYAATRDVSMAAQVKEEFERLDPVTKAEVKKLSKELVVRATTLKPQELAGISQPMGFWDPAGFSQNGDVAAFRRAELKHGRICMLASLGIIVEENFHPIFDQWNEGQFSSAVASHFSATATRNFWPAFWVMAASHEFATWFAEYEGKDLADYGFDPLGLAKKDNAEGFKRIQTTELNNGRLAMIATAGIIAQEMVTGKSLGEYYTS